MNTTAWLRYVAILEGISWLGLLFVAMPLKYMAGNPYPVKIVGMTHGLLFIGLVVLLSMVLQAKVISNKTGLKVFVASFIPFGTFFTDRQLKEAYAR